MTLLSDAVVALIGDGVAALGAELAGDAIAAGISRPPKAELGDLAFGCFPLARVLRRGPPLIANELADAIRPMLSDSPLVAAVSTAGPYLNFKAATGAYAQAVLPSAISGELGASDVGAGKTIVIDFSSPNVAKPFGIGHLRSTAIGAAIERLFEARGYRVVGINHIGDWGTQFGKMISAWKRWGDEAALEADPIAHLYALYVRFHREEKTDEALAQEGRDWFKRLEDGDAEARRLWQHFRDESLREFDRIYQRMGVSFDHTWGEAFYEDKIAGAVDYLDEQGVLEESEGALIVRVDEIYPNTSPCLIRRSDGASLYTTRDVTAALYRYERFQFDRMLYVTGADQADHFRKVFGTLKRLGLEWADHVEHVPFGRIHGISTREGTLVFLEDVLDRARELSLEQMRDRDMPPEEQQREAEKIGVGAVIFFDLSKERIKDADFNWKAILQITGRTGPGLQYTQVRLKSLLQTYRDRQGELPAANTVDYSLLGEPEARELVQRLAELGQVIERAAESYEPAVLARYLLDLADVFNTFYSGGNRIVGDDAALSAARVTLCAGLLAVLLRGMAILGVPAPDRM